MGSFGELLNLPEEGVESDYEGNQRVGGSAVTAKKARRYSVV